MKKRMTKREGTHLQSKTHLKRKRTTLNMMSMMIFKTMMNINQIKSTMILMKTNLNGMKKTMKSMKLMLILMINHTQTILHIAQAQGMIRYQGSTALWALRQKV